jgi:Rieske Fe-S protein
MNESTDLPGFDRRRLLNGAAALGIAVPLLAACGSDAEPAGSGSTSSSPQPDDSPSDAQSPSEPTQDGGGELVAAADVPVGGGVVMDADKVVVTQPAEGEFKAFTAVCTHQGCVVASVADNEIACPCHGSLFSAEDGSVLNGPATAPLTEIEVQVMGGSIVRA